MNRRARTPGRRRRLWIYIGGVLLLVMATLAFIVMRPQSMTVDFRDAPDVQLALEPWLGGLDAPLDAAVASDGSGRVFIVERAGRVRVVDSDGVLLDEPVLDISDRVNVFGEGGLLTIVFHPEFSSNPGEPGRFYVTWMSHEMVLTVQEFYLAPGSNVALPDSRIILEVPQPSMNHNGGGLAFGPDGYLYISVGDGHDISQQGLEAQSLGSLLGKMLRVDVDETGEDGRPYGIPADNPFLDDPDARPEIYAVGLRNPWRMTFHGNELWVSDVGGELSEEVNIVQSGGNYGWPIYEGNGFKPKAAVRHVLEGRIAEYVGDVLQMNFTESGRRIAPIAAYAHDGNSAAITGGLVVDDSAGLPGIEGRYIFADFIQGTISSLEYDQGRAVVTPLIENAGSIVSFRQAETGEILVLSLTGTIFQLTQK